MDGAVFAGLLKRKAGLLAPVTQGKDVYVVVNDRLKTLTLFKSDMGRVAIAQFESPTAFVAFDESQFMFGVKVWNESSEELFNGGSKSERETLVHALTTIGFHYKEDYPLDLDQIQSIYDLQDVDIDGNQVAMDKYKGKVLLVVNVASYCGLTAFNYPELAELEDKFHKHGLEILAFPCNQFGGQEPGTNDEIKAFVSQYNFESLRLFAKGDVNGRDTRPVFSYLKSQLPGRDGQYINWNFAKFLVDHKGQPVQRYEPTETPLSFELEIKKMLCTAASEAEGRDARADGATPRV